MGLDTYCTRTWMETEADGVWGEGGIIQGVEQGGGREKGSKRCKLKQAVTAE